MSELVMLFHLLHPLVATIPSSRLKLRPHTGLKTHYHITSLTSVQMVGITKGGDATPTTIIRTAPVIASRFGALAPVVGACARFDALGRVQSVGRVDLLCSS